ncbi:MAG TPA: SDR family oxidoreductase [Anaerolineales bacterium]
MTDDVFHENVVVLTGASRGIGRALARALAGRGAWLALAARDIARLEQVAEECRGLGGRAFALQTDVCDQTQCQRLIARSVNEYGRIDTLINNAGVTMWARFEDLQDLAPLETVMRTNYFGSVYCTYAALPYLKRAHGRIVAISSLAGKSGIPTRSGYAASKHAMQGFFDSLRIELAGYGVSVTIVCPDFVASEARGRAFGPDGAPLGKSPVQESKVMTAETCARLTLKAAARRQREEIMGLRGKAGMWLKMIAPGLVDRIARRAIERGR